MKFKVTLPGPRDLSYDGSYEVLDSGALKITNANGQLKEYFSPCGWLWVGEKHAGHEGPAAV